MLALEWKRLACIPLLTTSKTGSVLWGKQMELSGGWKLSEKHHSPSVYILCGPHRASWRGALKYGSSAVPLKLRLHVDRSGAWKRLSFGM